MITQLFPTKIYSENLIKPGALSKTFLDEIKYEILKISEIDLQGQKWSRKNYFGGFTSYGSMDQLHLFSTSFEQLKNKIDRHVFLFSKSLQYRLKKDDLQISKMWVNVMPKGVIHTGHIHPLSVISGTFYVDVPEVDSPALKFEDPRFNMMMACPPKEKKLKLENINFYPFVPKNGHLVLFESWLRHEVNQNTTDKLRISISFNYDWI